MKVDVHNNNIQRAMRVLNKKMKEENFWDEYKRHRYYEKPGVDRRRRRKLKALG